MNSGIITLISVPWPNVLGSSYQKLLNPFWLVGFKPFGVILCSPSNILSGCVCIGFLSSPVRWSFIFIESPLRIFSLYGFNVNVDLYNVFILISCLTGLYPFCVRV